MITRKRKNESENNSSAVVNGNEQPEQKGEEEEVKVKRVTRQSVSQQLADNKEQQEESDELDDFWVDEDDDEDWEEDDKLHEISKGVYLGSEEAARNVTALKQHNITHILTVATESEAFFPEEFKYLHIDINDHSEEPIIAYFDQCFTFIGDCLNNGGNVFIHCIAGVSRSATITIAFMMRHNKHSFEEAFKHVISRRPQISPNEGFIQQLKLFEKMEFTTTVSVTPLVAVGIIIMTVGDSEHHKVYQQKFVTLAASKVTREYDEDEDEDEDEEDQLDEDDENVDYWRLLTKG